VFIYIFHVTDSVSKASTKKFFCLDGSNVFDCFFLVIFLESVLHALMTIFVIVLMVVMSQLQVSFGESLV
jgi:hypothetical protein